MKNNELKGLIEKLKMCDNKEEKENIFEKMNLNEALNQEKVSMEKVIEKAEKDSESGIIVSDMYKEGGSMIYFYDTYTIIKKHSLDGNRDVYIGVPEMRLESIGKEKN